MVCLVLAIVSLSLAASTQASQSYAGSLSLLARQSGPLDPSTLPAQCQPSCTPIFGVLNTCTDATCLCTSTNGQNLENCMDCLISITETAEAEAQTVIDDYNNECIEAGAKVSPLSLLPGGTSAGTSAGTASTSVVVASATSTAPALTATGTGKTTESSVFFSLPSTASGEAATSTGTSGSGSSSNPFRNGAPAGGKRLGVWGVLGVFGVGLISAAVVLV